MIKIAWTKLRKRSKSMIFAKAIAFPNRIISKFSACGGLHSQQCSIYTPPKHRLLKHFSNSQTAIALSTQAQNVFLTVVGALRLDKIIFPGGYRVLYTYVQNVPYKLWSVRGRNFIIFDSRAATALSTHAESNCKKNCLGRKVRRRREKNEIHELK